MKLTNISAGPVQDGVSVSIDVILAGLSVSEAVQQVMARFSESTATGSSSYAITAPADQINTVSTLETVIPIGMDIAAEPGVVEVQADPAPTTRRRSRSASTPTEQPAEAGVEAAPPQAASASADLEPAQSSRRRRAPTEAVQVDATTLATAPSDAAQQPNISGEQAEDRISDPDLVKACSLAAAKLTPDVVRLIIRGAGALKEGQNVTEMPQDRRRQFLNDLDAEVAKTEPAAFTA